MVDAHFNAGSQTTMISRRLFVPLFASTLASCSRGQSALPIGPADLVQVAADVHRRPVPPLPAGSNETPTSAYCGGKPQWCSLTHVRDLRDPTVIGALTTFVNSYLLGLYDPWYGMPIGDVETYFFAEQRRIGTFGSGSNFFSRGAFPQSRVISASEVQIEEFHKLVHLK